jgi:hypothetical protein
MYDGRCLNKQQQTGEKQQKCSKTKELNATNNELQGYAFCKICKDALLI